MQSDPHYLILTWDALRPKLSSDLSEWGAFPLDENDCACPPDDFALQSPIVTQGDRKFVFSPAVFTRKLEQDVHLAFNPFVESGVVVLNQQSMRLLHAFEQPRRLVDGLRDIGITSQALTAVRQLLRLQLLTPAEAQYRPFHTPPVTLTAWLALTDACNLRCGYCYVSRHSVRLAQDAGWQALAAIIRSAKQHGFRRIHLKYAGGEPLLMFDRLLDLHDRAVQMASANGLELDGIVLTNGTLLTGDIVEQLQGRNLRMMLSLDGLGALQDCQRPMADGGSSFLAVERGLDILAARQYAPLVSITVTRANLSGLPELAAYLLARRLPFAVNFYRENDCAGKQASLDYDDQAMIAALQGVLTALRQTPPPYSLLGVLLDRTRLDRLHDRACGVGRSYLAIGADGSISSCHMDRRTIGSIADPDPLGNVLTQGNGIHNLVVDEKQVCRDCTWRYWCAGGCPALTYRQYGRYDAPSPNCQIYRTLLPEIIAVEAERLLYYSRMYTMPMHTN